MFGNFMRSEKNDMLLKKVILMATAKNSDMRIDQKTEEDRNDGAILAAHKLIAPKEISVKTLADIDQEVRNFKLSKVSDPVDRSDF